MTRIRTQVRRPLNFLLSSVQFIPSLIEVTVDSGYGEFMAIEFMKTFYETISYNVLKHNDWVVLLDSWYDICVHVARITCYVRSYYDVLQYIQKGLTSGSGKKNYRHNIHLQKIAIDYDWFVFFISIAT